MATQAPAPAKASGSSMVPKDPELALQDAKLRLLAEKPFYGFVVSRFPTYAHSRLVPVAAVVLRGPIITLHTNPDTFPYFPLRMRMRVLEHEVLHLLHRHIPLRQGLDPDLWNVACFKPDEPILTTGGLKPIAEVQVGDEAVGGGRVTAVMSRPYAGVMYRVRPWGCEPVVATGEHPFLVVRLRRGDLGRYEERWVEARRLPDELADAEAFLAIPRCLGGYAPALMGGPDPSSILGFLERSLATPSVVPRIYARQLQLLAARVGECVSVEALPRSGSPRDPAARACRIRWLRPGEHPWRMTDPYVLVPAEVSEERYEGPVYNVETETHRYLAGNVVVHNCDLAVNSLMKPDHPDYEDPEHPERSFFCFLPERLERAVGIKLPPSGDAELYYNLLVQDRECHGGKKILLIVSPDGKCKAIARDGDPRLGQGWKIYDLHPNFAKGQAFDDATGQAFGDMPPAEIIEGEIRSIIEEASKIAGSVPAELRSAVDRLFKPKVDWRRMLRRFAGSVITETRYRTWARPNRRIPVLPGVRHEPGAHIAAIIDTSGSMSDEELAAIGSELYQIAKLAHACVEVAEVDAQVHRTYHLTAPVLKTKMREGFTGRGGTVFRPGFEWAAKQKVDGIIYFTDGYNYDQDWLRTYRPPCPVLWVVTHNGQYPAEWGWRIKLPAPGED